MSEHTNPNPFRRATLVAGTVIGMGLVASVAGNIQSILLEEGSPSLGALISALWWPILLFAMIELALHTPWGGGGWRAIQWLGAGAIGGLAFYISFFHLAHVLSYFGYDVVSRYAGPLTVDVAMFVATLAMNRVGVAKRAALASGHEELATTGPVATVATVDEVATADLANDWGNLEAELASYVAAEVAKPVSAPPAPTAEPEPTTEPAEEPAAATKTKTLTKVPALAAKRIQAVLDSYPTPAELTALDAALAAEGIAGAPRTARRWRAAVANGTARVS